MSWVLVSACILLAVLLTGGILLFRSLRRSPAAEMLRALTDDER